MYGWSSKYPLSTLTQSNTATARQLDNQPESGAVKRNLSRLSEVLGRIPFQLRVNSGYRSPELNAAVGGDSKSQHLTGEAADVTPIGLSNEDLAVWLYNYRSQLPNLDQVIWYTDTSHVHISVSDRNRKEFYRSAKEGGRYFPWAPSATELAEMALVIAKNRPVRTAIGLWIALLTVGGAAVATALWWTQRRK
jgi:zinc D-Ala-D-Ala carboxypeptidase